MGTLVDQERQRIAQQQRASSSLRVAKEAKRRTEDKASESAKTEAEQSEVSEAIHTSDLVQSFVIVDAKLGLIINRDVWDQLSTQDKKLFFNRVKPIWDSIYVKHHPGSTETTDIMLFDLNQDFVTDYGNFTVWGK